MKKLVVYEIKTIIINIDIWNKKIIDQYNM